MKNKISIIIIFTLFSYSFSLAEGYKIKVQMNGLSDSIAYLGYYYSGKILSKDTAKINKKGIVTFSNKESLEQGVYLVLFPSLKMQYLEILIGKNQKFNIETDTSNIIKNLKIKGDKQNVDFYKFQNFMRQESNKKQALFLQKRLTKNKDSILTITKEIEQCDKETKAYWNMLSTKWKGHLLSTIIDAMREPEIPNLKIPDNIINKDSALQTQQYLYNKEHYFDYIKLKDNRLIRTPFFADKIDYYMTHLVIQEADSIIKEGVQLIEKSRGADDIFSYLIRYMFGYSNKSKLMGMDKVFVTIAEKYYLTGEAKWADSTFIEKIRDRVNKIKPNLIGNKAPALNNLSLYPTGKISLKDLHNKYIVIAFWEPHCGHCKKAIPALHKAYKNLLNKGIDIEVLAIQTQLKEKPWIDFIKNKKIEDWINAYDQYMITNFRNNYDIYSTPTLYLLDKDKKIIAKRLAVEQIEKIIEYYEKEKK
jgi:thiol-disulfide isomerase/thioredoxin